MKRLARLAAAAAVAALTTPASAVVYTYDAVITLDQSMITAAGDFIAPLPAGGPAMLNPYDEIVGTIRFANDARVTVFDNPQRYGEEYVRGGFDGGLSSFYWTLTGVEGEYLRPVYQEGSSSVGSFTTFGDLTTTSFSFTGADFRIRYRGDGPVAVTPEIFGAFGGSATFGSAPAPVPEPATWAMMIIGFGAVGAALRSRRLLVQGIAAA